MTEIIRNRTIRPSTRLETSKSYKIDTKNVSRGDILTVNIDHETKTFRKSYKFKGSDVANKQSISFRVKEFGTSIDISWSGATPIGYGAPKPTTVLNRTLKEQSIESIITEQKSSDAKSSFDPISNSDTTILILGTMPGDKSILIGEYYGHARNRFWKIISKITGSDLSFTYSEKKALLYKEKIGVWDVVHKAIRKGSLDSAIVDEVPNDLESFIENHKNLKVIAFNGTKARLLFDKYFNKKNGISYFTLPSSSPANTGIDFDSICKLWKKILINDK